MHDHFPGFFRKTPDQIKAIWKNCVFCVDANVLLNLYRYSPATSASFLNVLQKLKQRLHLPWQAASEFHEHRLGVIDKQTKTYDATAEHSKKLLRALESPREHPFVDAKLLKRVSEVLGELNGHLEQSRESRRKLLLDDPRLNEIADLFAGQVGVEPPADKRSTWIEDAKRRCEKKIPPGYRDAAKDVIDRTAILSCGLS
jgi:hypothetical protein